MEKRSPAQRSRRRFRLRAFYRSLGCLAGPPGLTTREVAVQSPAISPSRAESTTMAEQSRKRVPYLSCPCALTIEIPERSSGAPPPLDLSQSLGEARPMLALGDAMPTSVQEPTSVMQC